ncbi:WXG100 family type VII secretion target [Streptomyces sp. RKND-216]|uniref:WXG100 family type VII secretion target n=1 Tax=Streptomyces sp. RKND-216 TaxID=2562581 RepID=UPI00109DC340|nr:WXG100 family type VII secretion target [Streptomyces sp. RKND-216]THA27109.1 WXG100 family type VII secretion target [Streptomyces sp. RKND-216]
MSGEAGNGYEVRKSGMAGEAGKLDRAGDDVGDIRKAVDMQVCYPADTLGGSDSGPAHDGFADAWQAEAKVLEAALHELADKVRISQQNYQGADAFAQNGLNSAVGGDGLTTMPAPATLPHPGVTGGPAPGERPAVIGDPPLVGGPVPGERPAALGDPPLVGGPAPARHTPPGLADFG